MLVLSRNVGTSLKIDGDIKIYVMAVRGNQVKLGIDAPPEVVILRNELDDKRDKGIMSPSSPDFVDWRKS